MVDLPQPDAPIRHTNSPAAISSSTSRSAVTESDPDPKVLVTPLSETTLMSEPVDRILATFGEDFVEQGQVVDAR